MRHSAGENRKTVKLLRTLNPSFKRYPFALRRFSRRNVDRKSSHLGRAFLPGNDAADISKPKHPLVGGDNPELYIVGCVLLGGLFHFPDESVEILGVYDLAPEPVLQPFPLGIPEALFDLGSYVNQASMDEVKLPGDHVRGFH